MATRVLVLATHLSRTNAGAAHATIDISNALAESSWADVTVHAYSRDEDALTPALRFIQGRARTDPRFFWRVPSLYRVAYATSGLRALPLPPVDVCYTQTTELGLAYRRLFPDTPIISHTGHVLVDREFAEERATPADALQRLEALLLRRAERQAYAAPHWTHVVSTALVARQREAHLGLAAGFFQVRPLGVDGRRFDRSATYPDVRSQLRIPSDAFVIVSVARLVPWKGIDLLLRAAAAAATKPAVIVVGDGRDAGRLRATTAELGIAERVQFVGHAHPAPYMAAADLFVLPSAIESFGMAYAEAMHMGLPCIGLRNDPPRVLSSAADVIPHGIAGYCVSSEEELRARIDELASNRGLRQRLGDQAHDLATREYSVERYCAFLHELVERKRGASASPRSRPPAKNP